METGSTANEKTVLLTNEWPIGTISREDINEETNITGNETNYPQRNHPTVKTGENSQTETPPLPVDTAQASSRLQTTNENVSQEDGENRGEEQRVSQPVAKVETGGTYHGGSFTKRVYICLVITFYYFAIMMDDEAWPQLVHSRVVKNLGANGSHTEGGGCPVNFIFSNNTNVKVQQRSATINTYSLMSAYIPAIFSNVMIGRLTDKCGRRIGLYLAIAGAVLKYSIIAICIHFDLNIDVCYIGFVLYGVSGTYTVISQTSNAYAADITVAGTDRSFFFSIVSFFRALATLLGQFVAGYIIQNVGQFYIYIIAIGTMTCAFFIVTACFSESRTNQQRIGKDFSVQQSQRSGPNAIEDHRKLPTRTIRTMQTVLLGAYILTCLRDLGLTTVASLFLLDSPFCWTAVKIGWFMSMITGCKLVGMFLVGLFQKCASDVIIATIGTVVTAASDFLFTFAFNDLMVYCVPVVGFMGGLGYPLTGAMLSGVTSPDKQGFLFSLLGLVESAGTLCSGLGLNTLYSSTVGWMKGFVFLLSAVLCLLCVPLYMYCLVASRVRVDRVNDIKTDQS